MMAVRIIDLAMPDDEPYCAKCGRCKPLDAFGPDARKVNGRRSYCSECENAMNRARYQRLRLASLRVRFTMYGLSIKDE